MDDRWTIRPARSADAVHLAAIERRCFSDPWSPVGFEELFQAPYGVGLVAEGPMGIGGYLVGRTLADEAEILTFAVSPEHRGRGLGRRLLAAGLETIAARGAREVFLEVREGNLAARSLYRAAGFQQAGRRAAYYSHPVEDALVLRRPLAWGA